MYSPFRHISSIFGNRLPIHLTFFVTSKCNSKCPFCFYLKSADRQIKGNELSIDEINRISNSFGDLLWLAFSGGEIFLKEDLIEITKIFYRKNRPAIILLPTNGLLPNRIMDMTENILKNCPKSIIAVKLSIDGIGPEHDKFRNTPGSFEKTIQTYDILKSLLGRYPNFELGVNTVFSAYNQDSMDNIIDYVNGMSAIKTHTISLVRGNLSDKSFTSVDMNKYLKAIKRLENNLKTEGASKRYRFNGAKIKAAQDILQRKLIFETVKEKRRLIDCFAGELNVVMTEDGEIYPCEIVTQSLGNMRDYGYNIYKLLRSDLAQSVLKGIKDKGCYCTHECYMMTNILFNPRCYPALLKEYIKIS